MKRIIKKLGARNGAHAVCLAISSRLILPVEIPKPEPEPDGLDITVVTEAPVSTEPGCQHPDCTLDHPHAGPAVLEPVANPERVQL